MVGLIRCLYPNGPAMCSPDSTAPKAKARRNSKFLGNSLDQSVIEPKNGSAGDLLGSTSSKAKAEHNSEHSCNSLD
jgi:hypothetical protein